MQTDIRVKIPEDRGRIIRKRIKGSTYVYYQLDRKYDPEKGYSVPRSTTIGKVCPDDDTMMFPNKKFLVYYADAELPEERGGQARSSCLRVGTFMILRKIIEEYRLDEVIGDLIGKDAGLFLDLAAYSIVTEGNAAQYYPDYAYNHPLFTEKMHIYSDSRISSFINEIDEGCSVEFLNRWNEKHDHREKIYLSYDSTNKNCQAGDVELVEYGHPKDGCSLPVVNYSIGYDKTNREPLFYEAYPGSIVDISQLHYMIGRAAGYGYKKIGFILDRGYFSRENIRYMDRCGYDFIIMMKGMKDTVSGLILENKGKFEESRKYSIRSYRVSGMTVKGKLFPSDERERYFHLYYNDGKRAGQREHFEEKIDRMGEVLKKQEGAEYACPSGFEKYFDLICHTQGKTKILVAAREKSEVIDREIKLSGYFVIVTSEKMTAEEALDIYKSRDGSEKLFRGDKSYLGNRSFRVHSTESVKNKIFIEFVALIIRSRFYTYLKEQMRRSNKKENYMTVPAALRELEKIEMIRLSDGNYRMDHAVTATQKEILGAFGMTERNVREQAVEINKMIQEAGQQKDGKQKDIH